MWSRAIWEEDGAELDGVIPTNWIDGNIVFYPTGVHVKKAYNNRQDPEESWVRFLLKKVTLTSDDWKLCEDYSFPSENESKPVKAESSSKRNAKNPPLPKFELSASANRTNSPLSQNMTRKSPRNQQSEDPYQQVCSEDESTVSPRVTRKSPRTDKSSEFHQQLSPEYYPPRFVRRTSPRKKVMEQSSTNSASPRAKQNCAPVRKSFASSFGASFNEKRKDTNTVGYVEYTIKQSCTGTSGFGNASTGTRSCTNQDKYPLTNAKFQSRVIYLLTDIRNNIRNNQQRSGVNDTGNLNIDMDEMHVQKCENLEEFNNLETSIQDKKSFDELAKQLSKVGGSTPQDNTRNAMLAVMSNSLMSQFNMKGNKGRKIAFTKKKVCDAIVACVIHNHKETTKSVIYTKMASVLKYAPDRVDGGGRTKETNADDPPAGL